MEKRIFVAKKSYIFRRKSDGVIVGRFVIDTTIDDYEEIFDQRPRSQRVNPHRPSLRKVK